MTAPAPEATPAQGTATVPDATQTNPPEGAQTPPVKPDIDWKKMAREWEDKAKANKNAADELNAIKESQKTAEQKAADEAARIQKELEQTKAENIRYKAAALHGISEENFDLLGTGSEEEILQRAERIGQLEDAAYELAKLKETLGTTAPAAAPNGSVAALRPGTPAVPDDSYPQGWFPSLTPKQPTN